MRPNYSIIRCCTTDKSKVMDLLCDADEYKLINNHIDIVYFNGDTPLERKHGIDDMEECTRRKSREI
jgi:hypothetical protein